MSIDSATVTASRRRVYLGGLTAAIDICELEAKVNAFVREICIQSQRECLALSPIEIMQAKNDWTASSKEMNCNRGFAYMTFQGQDVDSVTSELIRAFNKTKWHGALLRFEIALPDYKERLEIQWKEEKERKERHSNGNHLTYVGSSEFVPPNVSSLYKGEKKVFGEAHDKLASGKTASSISKKDHCDAVDENPHAAVREDISIQLRTENALDGESTRHINNVKRLQALEKKKKAKEELILKEKGIGISSITSVVTKQKIVFDENGEATSVLANLSSEHKAPVISNWLDADESDDEASNDHGSSSIVSDLHEDGKKITADFAIRPEFSGPDGKRMFELQKSYGGDSRFRLDSRFMDTDNDEFLDRDDTNASETDEQANCQMNYTTQLLFDDGVDNRAKVQGIKDEERRALALVGELFPEEDFDRHLEKTDRRTQLLQKLSEKQYSKSVIREASWMGHCLRYDPTNAAHTKLYEIDATNRDFLPSANAEEGKKTQETPSTTDVLESKTGGDRFFKTCDGLSTMFTRIRKNSEDGIVGEAAMDGILSNCTLGADKVTEDPPCKDELAAGTSFRLSSIFESSIQNKKSSAFASSIDIHEDDDVELPIQCFDNAMQESSTEDQDMNAEEFNATDSESGHHDSDMERETQKTDLKPKDIQDFLALGFKFSLGQQQKTADWEAFRSKLTIDYKRKRKEALKNRKRLSAKYSHDKSRDKKTKMTSKK